MEDRFCIYLYKQPFLVSFQKLKCLSNVMVEFQLLNLFKNKPKIDDIHLKQTKTRAITLYFDKLKIKQEMLLNMIHMHSPLFFQESNMT